MSIRDLKRKMKNNSKAVAKGSKSKARTVNSETAKAYSKELKRARKLVKSLEQRGYTVPKSVKKTLERKKRPTKRSVEALKNINAKTIYKKSKYKYKDEKGKTKTVSGEAGRKIERSKASKKGWENRKKRKGSITNGGVNEAPNANDNFFDIAFQNFIHQLEEIAQHPNIAQSKKGARKFAEACYSTIDKLIQIINTYKEKYGVEKVVLAIENAGIPTSMELYEGRIAMFLTDFERGLYDQGVLDDKDMRYFGQGHDEEDFNGYDI